MSITHNPNRVGRFTASSIHLLIEKGSRPMTEEELIAHKKENPTSRKKNIADGFKDGGITYIKKKAYERILGRSMEIEKYSNSMAWGHFLEQFVFSEIGFEWKILSNETKVYNRSLAGSTDLLVEGVKVADIKCYEPFKFVDYSLCLLSKDLGRLKKDFKQEYWQLVCNAVVNKVDRAEAMVFMPTLEQLKEIKQMALDYEGSDAWKYRFIYERNELDLPHIPKGCELDPLNTFEFEVPQEDKELLLERVKLAEQELKTYLK